MNMLDLIRSRVFINSFLVAYAMFFAVTLWLFDSTQQGPGIGYSSVGFPFTYYRNTCFGGYYVASGILANILFAALVAAIIGLFAAYVCKTLSPREPR